VADRAKVTIDGELMEHGHSAPKAPQHGLVVALGITALLAFSVGRIVFSSTSERPDSTARPSAPPSSSPVVPIVATTPKAVLATSAAPTVPSTVDARVSAAKAALAAWGRFAASGQASDLADTFAPDGPQLRQLLASKTAVGGPAYNVTLDGASAQNSGTQEATVIGTSTWKRAGEEEQTHRWQITLRRAGEAWMLWNVRTVGVS
jgi:hypothetical protein